MYALILVVSIFHGGVAQSDVVDIYFKSQASCEQALEKLRARSTLYVKYEGTCVRALK